MSVLWGTSVTPRKKKTRKREKLELPATPSTPKCRQNKTPKKTKTDSDSTSSSAEDNSRILFGDVIPPKIGYLAALKYTKRHFELPNGDCVLADCDLKTGLPIATHRYLRRKLFRSSEDQLQGYIFLCNCAEGCIQNTILTAADSDLSEGFLDFFYRETDNHCPHAKAAMELFSSPFSPYQAMLEAQPLPSGILPLCDTPYLVAAVQEDEVFLIEYNRGQRLVCTCSNGQRQCSHKKIYEEWCVAEGINGPDERRNRTSNFECASTRPINVPLSADKQQIYRDYEAGSRSYPQHLIPTIEADQPTCPHGCEWDRSDPVDKRWLAGIGTIYKETCSITQVADAEGEQAQIKVYYRLCTGSCRCMMKYDGHEHLLFNLDDVTLLHYGLLFSYLHHMLEGRNPLAACHRAYKRSHIALSGTKCIPLHKLRLAWNAFARLLSIEWSSVFECPKCGKEPSVVVCDGTSLGFRKDLLAGLNEDTGCGDLISGSVHTDRVFIPSKKVRDLLLQFATGTPLLTEDEFSRLCANILTIPHLIPLKALLEKCAEGLVANVEYRDFLKDLARNGPACALLQGADDSTLCKLKEYIHRSHPFSTESIDEMTFIQKEFPLFFGYIIKAKVNGKVPDELKTVLLSIIKRANNPFMGLKERTYAEAPPVEAFKDVGFFPALPKRHRKGNYTMDHGSLPSKSETECRKFSKGHPSLSPGIFTVYCPHGVCYGFQVMTRHESAAIPFDIFKTRFDKAPSVIIYDNACQLHAYCLNREPAFFQDTVFLVDRMHWFSHRSCCQGYNINSYKGRLDLKKINTQVNEQANAGLARIKAQLAYMLPDNFIFHAALYLAFKNKSKKESFL